MKALVAARAAPTTAAIAETQEQPVVAPSRAEAPFDTGKMGLLVDGYYSYNFNQPTDGLNPLRAYDRRHNSFGLNQASLVFERQPEPEKGQRLGVRVDLMYGQATNALQGSPLNELQPDIYRPVFQAYGTYVAPIGSGLTIDFGKWASALGLEGNYTIDQVNYSRSYLFNFLPFYHFGFRTRYDFTDEWGASYWLVNGNGQSMTSTGSSRMPFSGTGIRRSASRRTLPTTGATRIEPVSRMLRSDSMESRKGFQAQAETTWTETCTSATVRPFGA